MEMLKILRKNANLTQEELANKLQIKRTTYASYENTDNEPDIDTLIKIADYFDVSLDFLCGRARPYDLPSIATQEQRQTVNIVLKLNDLNTLKAQSYCEGLLASQKEER